MYLKNEEKKRKEKLKKEQQKKENPAQKTIQLGARNYLATTFPHARVYRPRCGLATLSPIIPTFPRSLLPMTNYLQAQPTPVAHRCHILLGLSTLECNGYRSTCDCRRRGNDSLRQHA